MVRLWVLNRFQVLAMPFTVFAFLFFLNLLQVITMSCTIFLPCFLGMILGFQEFAYYGAAVILKYGSGSYDVVCGVASLFFK